MNRFTLLLPALALVACSDKTQLDPNYCGHQDGDSYCARQDPSRPYCVLGFDECFEAAGLPEFSNGCVAETPAPECSTPCGIGNEDGCTDPTNPTEGSSSGSTTDEPSSTTEAETDTETEGPTTTTGPECMDNAGCMDAALPFCIEQTCSPCSASVDVTPDEACAGLDEATPLCVDDTCVQCTAENASACSGTTPLCSAESNTCVACSFHEECQAIGSPACNLATGACFDPDAVTEVSLSSANAIQNAINAVPDGAEHAVVITGGSGLHTITVDGGKTIAIVSDSTTLRSINGNSSAVLTVTGNNTTVFLHRVRLEDSDDVGIEVSSGASLFADSTQVAQNAGGGITLASGTSAQLRNCMVAGEGGNPGQPAITATGADLKLLYSTLGLDFNNGGSVLECSGGSVSVRNSVIVSEASGGGSEIDCPGATVENSAEETTLSPTTWFPQFATGDYSLSAAGQSQFADVAVWEDGDPPFDFDGDARPNVDGTADYAGADAP